MTTTKTMVRNIFFTRREMIPHLSLVCCLFVSSGKTRATCSRRSLADGSQRPPAVRLLLDVIAQLYNLHAMQKVGTEVQSFLKICCDDHRAHLHNDFKIFRTKHRAFPDPSGIAFRCPRPGLHTGHFHGSNIDSFHISFLPSSSSFGKLNATVGSPVFRNTSISGCVFA